MGIDTRLLKTFSFSLAFKYYQAINCLWIIVCLKLRDGIILAPSFYGTKADISFAPSVLFTQTFCVHTQGNYTAEFLQFLLLYDFCTLILQWNLFPLNGSEVLMFLPVATNIFVSVNSEFLQYWGRSKIRIDSLPVGRADRAWGILARSPVARWNCWIWTKGAALGIRVWQRSFSV